MDDERKDDAALDALFAAAKATPPEMSDNFMARLMADADAALPMTQPVAQSTPATPWLRSLKGWFAASGLSGAAALGLWIGFVMPDTLNSLSLASEETVALYTFLPGADLTAPEFSE